MPRVNVHVFDIQITLKPIIDFLAFLLATANISMQVGIEEIGLRVFHT
jgi:hypothetical protein